MNYFIKEIEKDDLYDYIYVNTYAWDETYRGIMDDEFLDKIKFGLNQNVDRKKQKFDQDKIDAPDFKKYLLYVDSEPVGIFSVSKSHDEKYQNAGELCSLYLLNKAKKHGYGRIMFERAKQELRNMKFKNMVVHCLKDNPTKEFYEHMGGELVYSIERRIGGKDLIENVYYFNKI